MAIYLEKQKKSVWPVVITGFLAIAALILSIFYYYLAWSRGAFQITWQKFYLIQFTLALLEFFFFLAYWRRHSLFGPKTTLVFVMWFGNAFWNLWFAPIYDLLILNVDQTQLRLIAFNFNWEAAVFGLAAIVFFILLYIPIDRAAQGKIELKNPRLFYRYILAFPLIVAITIFIVTTGAFVLGSYTFKINSFFAPIEFLKNILDGSVTSFFTAVLFYLFYDSFLDKARLAVEKKYLAGQPIRRKFSFKYVAVTLALTLGSVVILGIVALQSFQILIRENVIQQTQSQLNTALQDIESEPTANHLSVYQRRLKMGANSQLFFLTKGQTLAASDKYSPTTLDYINSNSTGIVDDSRYQLKTIFFFTDPSVGYKVVNVVYLNDFYQALTILGRFVLFGAVFVLLLSIGVTITFIYLLTRPLGLLTDRVKRVTQNKDTLEVEIGTADEFEDLSNALTYFVEQTQSSRQALEKMNVTLERKIKDRTLQLQENVLRLEEAKVKDEALLGSIGDGLIATDKTGNIIIVNSPAEQMLGYRALDLIGRPVNEVIPVVDDNNHPIEVSKQPYLAALHTGKRVTTSLSDNYKFVRRDKSSFAVSVTSTPIILNGQTTGTIIIFRDITHEKDIDRAKSEFVSLASHQLRTPLSAINWYTEMLTGGDAGSLNTEQQSYLGQIYEASKRMVDLVNSLLNVSRLELGTFTVEPEDTNILEIIKSVLDELKPQFTAKKQVIEEKYDKQLPVMQLDPKLIRMVFQNLLSNSVKYTPDQGKISISVMLEQNTPEGRAANTSGNVIITVSDNGYGVPKSQQAKIFTKLFRADNVKAKISEGTGLGLYIVKSIVEQSGGSISFESEENKGTTFYIKLPMTGMHKKVGSKKLT